MPTIFAVGSVMEIWPMGDYSQYMPAPMVESSLGRYWENVKSYLNKAVVLQQSLDEQQANDIEQFNIIQSFASNLLNNTKNLDPEFSRTVDDHFWDLV